MSKDTKKKISLGIVVTIACVLFVTGIFLIGSKEDLYSKTIKIYTVFSDVNGLREGDYVRFSGSKAGIVSKIEFQNDSMIKVEMKIEKEMQNFIKKDAVAYIATEGLVGNKLINIRPMKKSRENVSENDVLTASNPLNTEDIMEKLATTNENAEIISQNLAKLSERINQGKGIFGTLVSDSSVSRDLKLTMQEIRKSSKKLDDNLEAMQHNFLLRGFFKKREKEKEKKEKEQNNK